MRRRLILALSLLLLAALPAWAAPYEIKTADEPAPAELADEVRPLLAGKCIQLLDAKNEVLAEVWFRKAVPAKATDAQIQNGLTYAEIPDTSLVGALRVAKPMTDYR